MKKKFILRIIFFIAVFIFFLCSVWFITLLKPAKNGFLGFKNVFNNSSESENIDLPDNPIDFKSLQNKNSDVYAWITVPGTKVDYPVVQANPELDDNFYLNKNIDKKYEFAGMIYSQRLNKKDFLDPVTVLYGHNMLNGTMFASLHQFEDADFFHKHDTIYIYTPGHILTYKIVSAFIYDDRHILNTFDFSKEKDLHKYIKTITNPKSYVSNVRKDVTVDENSHILTLSTCTAVDTQRYLVEGVLVNDKRTK